MKITLLIHPTTRETLFSQKAMDRLGVLGEVALCATDDDMAPGQVGPLLKGSDILVTSWGSPRVEEALLDEMPDLTLLVHAAGSVKPVVSDALWARGVRVAGSAKALGIGVAETALGMTIAGLKHLPQVSRDIAAGGWAEHYGEIRELYDVVVGIVGLGYAGAHYAKLLGMFDVERLAHDPYLDASRVGALGAVACDLHTLLARSDVVSIHAPSIPETRHMFNARTLAMMKPDAILINTARGSLVDEAALAAHMRSGKLRYAFLDVTDPEPPPADHPLRRIERCVMTPHLAGLTNNGKRRIGASVAERIEAYVQTRSLPDEITRAMLATMA